MHNQNHGKKCKQDVLVSEHVEEVLRKRICYQNPKHAASVLKTQLSGIRGRRRRVKTPGMKPNNFPLCFWIINFRIVYPACMRSERFGRIRITICMCFSVFLRLSKKLKKFSRFSRLRNAGDLREKNSNFALTKRDLQKNVRRMIFQAGFIGCRFISGIFEKKPKKVKNSLAPCY